ncbi:hypothetical protein TrVE_jg6328 [Triparma verrucosa]|uniref:Dynactin subunit 5 n=1 Tax=Triparma verrucosa TaxID=1606542 RepID=A0A9W7BTN8_9STRA|nr:hypothetical protein TrVE_jg6328 [Triparma verrucosa]
MSTDTQTTQYIRTSTLSYISRSSILTTPETLLLSGKCVLTSTHLSGDDIKIGRSVCLDAGSVLKGTIVVGKNTMIGPKAEIIDSNLGSYCHVCPSASLTNCVIKDCCVVLPGSVLKNFTCPPYSVVGSENGVAVIVRQSSDNMEFLLEGQCEEMWERVGIIVESEEEQRE